MKIRRYKNNCLAVYAANRPPARQTDEIEKRLETEKADVLVLGTYPALCMSYIDPRDFSCEYPLSFALAVSVQAEERFGKLDGGLGAAAAYEYTKLVSSRGGKVAFAGDILLETHESDIPDVTDNLLGCILFDAKHRDGQAFSASFSRLAGAFRKDPQLGDHSRKKLLAVLPGVLLRAFWYRTFGHRPNGELPSPEFKEMQRRGRYVASPAPREEPPVSVVIRTCGRPETLRKTLDGLQYQAYKNVEYIVVEDGEPSAEKMVKTEFAHLPIRYRATGKKTGRAAAANLGFSMATGSYINMLDDDDYLYPEHILAGVAEAEAKGCDMVFLQSLALLVTKVSDRPYAYDINEIHFMDFPRIDPFTMAQQCVTPNNGVLFRRELYEELGGMREELGAHEDWSLWLKYMTKAEWSVIPYALNVFLNPFSQEEQDERDRRYAPYDGMQFDDASLVYETAPEQLRGYYLGCIADWHCLAELGRFEYELQAESARRKIRTDKIEGETRDEFAETAECKFEKRHYTAKEFRGLYEQFLKYLNSLPPSESEGYIVDIYRKLHV